MYVHCGTVYKCKDLEPTQMPIKNRLEKENVADTHHGTQPWKRMSSWPLQGHGWSWKPSLSANTTENQTLHVLTHKWELNNENTWTQGGELYTLGSVVGNRRGTAGGGELGRDSMGRNARYRWRGGRQQITLPRVYLCNYPACSSHVPQNLKCKK